MLVFMMMILMLAFIYEILNKPIISWYLWISSNLINAARKFARINGPRYAPLQKVKVSCNSCLTQEMQDQFEIFFQDKANVTISSHRSNNNKSVTNRSYDWLEADWLPIDDRFFQSATYQTPIGHQFQPDTNRSCEWLVTDWCLVGQWWT